MCVCAKSLQLCLILCNPVDYIAHQVPLPMGFSGQEYWGRLPCLPPGDLPDLGMELMSLLSPALADGFFITSATWEAQNKCVVYTIICDSMYVMGFPSGTSGKEPACNAGDTRDEGFIPGSGRSPGGRHGNSLQYSCPETPLDRGVWWATVHIICRKDSETTEAT